MNATHAPSNPRETATQCVTALVVEDDEFMRCSLEDRLRLEGIPHRAAASYAGAILELSTGCIDLVITDIRLPDGSGIDLFTHINHHHPGTPVILITGFGEISDAVSLVRQGAVDYLPKPFDIGELIDLLRRQIGRIEDLKLLDGAAIGDELRLAGSGFLGVSAQMRDIERLIARLRDSESTVFITGESGVGKEVIATMVHANSKRRDGPMVRVNCAALAPGLIESELFGHEKGAFTGAHQARAGRFEQANGGTIFLDEIAEIPPEIQVKLLRVLQEREVERVGGQRPIPLDVRVLAATQVDLEEAIEEGSFRADLYYRINVIRIHVPPLRERRDDVPFLARRFIRETAASDRSRTPPPALTHQAEEYLKTLEFRGNVRELKNLVERALVLSSGHSITAAELGVGCGLSPAPDAGGVSSTLKESLEIAERHAIESALEKSGRGISRAARMLGVSRKTLWEKMKRLQISR